MTTKSGSHPELDTAQRKRVDVILQGLSTTPQSEWRARIDEVCRDDDTRVRSEVVSIIEQIEEHGANGTFLSGGIEIPTDIRKHLDHFAHGFDQHEEEPQAAPALTRIGRYTIKSVIASGGMGTVYQAVQDQPHRTVAIKIMKRGLSSDESVRRFENESQLLASLDHANIACVHEAGTQAEDGSARGVPWFAMEYIEGALPITKFADKKSLSPRDRVMLFLMVCDAVDHGHEHGVIHRDLKPANVLVNQHGQVKVIDFGVARATQEELATTTMRTSVGQLIGTLQYMSPEQCRGCEVDERSDVFSLGVMLYELLAGHPPLDVMEIGLPEAVRRICDEPPTALCAHDTSLRGDLETIVMKAIEKDPARRYERASELHDDLQRYLRNEPIMARPPSALYRMQKFSRRNALLIGGATVGGLAVGGGSWLTWWLAKPKPPWPPKLRGVMMAYDEHKGETALFGGSFASGDRGQGLWAWDGDEMRKVEEPRIDPRSGSPMVYDSARRQFVLVGGANGDGIFRNTYFFQLDVSATSESYLVDEPHAINSHAMVYDTKRRRLVLFGGYYQNGRKLETYQLFGDTLVLGTEAKKWEKIDTSVSPSPRQSAVMVYDEERDVIVLFGGFAGTSDEDWGAILDETWLFHPDDSSGESSGESSGGSWEEVATDSTLPFQMHTEDSPNFGINTMLYDSFRKVVVALSYDGAMWEWRDRAWVRNELADHPLPRSGFGAAYDRTRKCIVLFGGQTRKLDVDQVLFNDLWEFSSENEKWTQRHAV